MTRQEEIELAWLSRAVQSNYRYDEKSFKEAVEWSDKTMIEKTLQWLKAHIKFETVTYSDVWDVSVVDIVATDFTTVDEMEESFRKAVEK